MSHLLLFFLRLIDCILFWLGYSLCFDVYAAVYLPIEHLSHQHLVKLYSDQSFSREIESRNRMGHTDQCKHRSGHARGPILSSPWNTQNSTPCFPAVPGQAPHSLSLVFTQLLSWYHSAGMVEKRTWLLWWWQAAASDYTLPPPLPYPRFTPSGLLQRLLDRTIVSACALPPPNNNIFTGISFKPKPYEMQVHWETPEPVRFKQQNFFSKDNTTKRQVVCCCCRRRCFSVGRFVFVWPLTAR